MKPDPKWHPLLQSRGPNRRLGFGRMGHRTDLSAWAGLQAGAPALSISERSGRRLAHHEEWVIADLS